MLSTECQKDSELSKSLMEKRILVMNNLSLNMVNGEVKVPNLKERKIPKSAAQRQAERRARLRANPDAYKEYLMAQRLKARVYRQNLPDTKKEERKERERLRKREQRKKKKTEEISCSIDPSEIAHSSSSDECAMLRTDQSELEAQKSPIKKRALVTQLAYKVKFNFQKKDKDKFEPELQS